jgi:DNA-binding IclR family transcriptional regulator
VGKLLLARRLPDDDAVRDWLLERELTPRTPRTIVDPEAFVAELARTRARGYAVDDQENELGINCVAVPARVPAPAGVDGAVSISALAYRLPLVDLERQVDEIAAVVAGVRTD